MKDRAAVLLRPVPRPSIPTARRASNPLSGQQAPHKSRFALLLFVIGMMESPPSFPSRLAHQAQASRRALPRADAQAGLRTRLALESAVTPPLAPENLPPTAPPLPGPRIRPPRLHRPPVGGPPRLRTGVIAGVVLAPAWPRVPARSRAERCRPRLAGQASSERMASAHSSLADSVLTSATGSPIMQTNVSLIDWAPPRAAFQIAANGEITARRLPCRLPPPSG